MSHPDFATALDELEKVVASLDPGDLKAIKATVRNGTSKWSAFRTIFEDTFGAKCWYTEASSTGALDDVDHFRPKLGVTGEKEHPGYWWLAFDWHNFRLSSQVTNRLRRDKAAEVTSGKGNAFPLLDGSPRWMSNDAANEEIPSLLDPTNPADPPLLWFNISGFVEVSPRFASDSRARQRVKDSRVFLQLDAPEIVEARRGVYAEVRSLVDQGDDIWKAGIGNRAAELARIAGDLVALTRPRSTFSAAATIYVNHFRTREWLAELVLPNIRQLEETYV